MPTTATAELEPPQRALAAPAAQAEPATTDSETDRPIVRSPRALGAVLGGVVGTAAVVALPHALNRTDEGFRADLVELIEPLPGGTGVLLDALGATIALVLLVVVVGYQLAHRRSRSAAVDVLAAMAGAAGPIIAGLAGFSDRWTGAGTEGGHLVAISIAVAGAACTTVALERPTARARRAAVAAAGLLALGGAWGPASVSGRLVWLLSGVVAAGIVLLAAGSPSRRPTGEDVADALEHLGMPVASLDSHGGDARGSTPWIAELATGRRVFVKVASPEERVADLLFRLWRRIRLRSHGDARPHASLAQAAEHEALAATRAAALGVRSPRVLAMAHVGEGGVLTVLESVSGDALDAIAERDGPDAITESMLREAWAAVAALHRAHLAHRDLRAANVMVDEGGDLWLVDFAVADLMADEHLERVDLVELLCSTAALVGPRRAVDVAVSVLGEQVWADALPIVQPLATSTATRTALGSSGFADVRDALAQRVQAPSPELPRLGRIDWRTGASIVALGLATWTLLPQLADSDGVWEQIPRADRGMLALAAVVSLASYAAAATSLRGAVPRPLGFFATTLAQVASSFANRVTPAKVGGTALNLRWLVTAGVEAPVAAAGVSLNAGVGVVLHVLLTTFVVLWVGRSEVGELGSVSPSTVLIGLGVLAAVVAAATAIAPVRRLVRHRLWPRVRQSLAAVAEVATAKRQLGLLIAGSLAVTACYVAALHLSLASVGVEISLPMVALVYLAASALASAAPTPGGLGATEAAFAGALAAVGVEQTAAIAGVLVYRLVTFWLPIIPGWLAFVHLQRSGQL